jgi:hypothetical protein
LRISDFGLPARFLIRVGDRQRKLDAIWSVPGAQSGILLHVGNKQRMLNGAGTAPEPNPQSAICNPQF